MKNLSLTNRDLALLEELCAHRAVPVEQLALRYFSANPFTGKPNTNPHAACERRLNALAAAGHVLRFFGSDGVRARVLIGLGPNASSVVGGKAKRRVPVRNMAHHARTLDALDRVEAAVCARGGRVIRSRVEQQVRSDEQRGRFIRAGDTFSPFPDAVCTAELPAFDRSDGPLAAGPHPRSNKPRAMKRVEIAVEYATSKYTDEDIRTKHEGFGTSSNGGYDVVLWFADRRATQQRVQRITGASCTLVS